MLLPRFLVVAILSSVANCVVLDKAIVYSKEECKGREHTVNPDDRCTLLPENLRGKINGAKVPEGVVCDFYVDEACEEPLWIGMEDPGICNFAELGIENQAVSVHCYDDTQRDEV